MKMLALTLNGDWDPRPGVELSPGEVEHHWARDARQVWRNPVWAVTNRPIPKLERPDSVLIKVHRAGIARSNVKMSQTDAQGYVMLPYSMRLPVVPGHEVAGEVVEVGPGVRHMQIGDPVTVEAIRPCGHCPACRMRRPNHCLDSGFAGLTVDGGMAEFISVPEAHVISLRHLANRFGFEKALDIGVVCETAAVAYVGMFDRAGGFKPGAKVAVFGCGPIGLSAIALARCGGAATIIAFDHVSQRLTKAADFGADFTVDIRELAQLGQEPAAAIAEFTHGQGIDFAVEATGDGSSFFPQIEQALAIEAKILSLGVERDPVAIRLLPYQQSGGQITGMLGHLGGFEPVIALQAAGRFDLSKMIERRFELSDAMRALTLAAGFQEAKIILLPQAPRT